MHWPMSLDCVCVTIPATYRYVTLPRPENVSDSIFVRSLEWKLLITIIQHNPWLEPCTLSKFCFDQPSNDILTFITIISYSYNLIIVSIQHHKTILCSCFNTPNICLLTHFTCNPWSIQYHIELSSVVFVYKHHYIQGILILHW